MMIAVRVIDRSFNLLGEIDDFISLIITRRHYGIGEFELHIHADESIETSLKDKILWFGTKKYRAGFVNYSKYESKDGMLIIKGLMLKAITKKRVTVPGDTGYDRVMGDAETVIKHYVNNHLVNPVDSNRKLEGVAIASNQNRGKTTPWQSRYEKLDEVMEEIGVFCDMGYKVELDLINKGFILDVVEGEDKTIAQSIRPPVIFSSEFDSLNDMEYIHSNQELKTVGYAGGKGEDEERLIQTVGNATGWDREEVFLDCSSAEDAEELVNLGEQKLSELKELISLEGNLSQSNSFVYEEDWDLGDKVTVQDRNLGLVLHTRIIEVRESYEGGSMEVEATFGDSIPTLKQYFKKKENVR